jgi:glycosyltransferase involved in cell wall biosynthesis
MTAVIHVDTERTWRGGENQVFHLAKGLESQGFTSVIAAPFKSALMDKTRRDGLLNISLRSTREFSYHQMTDLRNAVKTYKAGIIHVHTSHGLISAGLVKKMFEPSLKIVYSRRTDFHLRTGLFGLSRKKYIWSADKIISVSDAIKKILVFDGLPEQRISTVYSGIDTESFSPGDDGRSIHEELKIASDTVIVGMIAALVTHKDPFTFFRAAELLAQSLPETMFLLVGAGHLREELQKALAHSPIRDRFVMTGFRRDVARLLAAMDIFCMSSREEGLCTSILDAMAMAKPVVATRAGGIPEAVSDGETGYIVPVGDSGAMAEKTRALVSDIELRKTMGIAGRKRVCERFDIRDTIRKTAEIYRELLNEI